MPDVQWPDANDLFEEWQGRITDWESFQREVNALTSAYADKRFVWRGQTNARWGLHSSLYRKLAEQIGEPPSEGQMIDAEARLLELARAEWRLDGISAPELFARMQHVGVPTRLIDVTFNPLIAAWFAVARDDRSDDEPGRLFVFTDDGNYSVKLNSHWKRSTPKWHFWTNDDDRRRHEWGTGLGRRIWRPPVLHDRISAQNAGFIVDGVPISSLETGTASSARRPTWNPRELRLFSSVQMRLAQVGTSHLPRKAPVFTFLITPQAKRDVRHQLEQRFGYGFASMYGDIEGLAEFVRRWPAHALIGRDSS